MLLLLLLWLRLLVLPAGTWAQSGEGASDMEPTLFCTSHISFWWGTNITCQLLACDCDLEDDEDQESDSIEKMTACCCDLGNNTKQCVEVFGDSLFSKVLNPISPINLTAFSKRGLRIEANLNLKKIIKPKCPEVNNVTLNRDQARVHIKIPYHKDFLRLENLLFQLQLWSQKTSVTQNFTSDSMNIGRSHLRSGTEYHVKVRSIPWDFLQGSWSEWSQTYSFTTPPGESLESRHLVWLAVIPPAAALVLILGFLYKYRILTDYMWPSIPQPKTSFEKICKPHSSLLLTNPPEVFSSLNVYTMDHSAEALLVKPPDGTEETPSCSAQSSDVSMSSSVETEELELSQSSSSEGEQNIPKTVIPKTEIPRTTPKTDFNDVTRSERDNSYVTMSSFYQIKSKSGDG